MHPYSPIRYVEPVYRPPSEADSLILPVTDGCSWSRCSFCELTELHDAGLKLAYLGAESGDDGVLARVNKGESFASTRAALDQLGAAGIRRSVMIINGLGGAGLSIQHAENSARLINATAPEYLSTLVLTLPDGGARFRAAWPDWQALPPAGLFREMERFLSALELRRTLFRSDHASNWLVLKGMLGADQARLLAQVRMAIDRPDAAALRPAGLRGM